MGTHGGQAVHEHIFGIRVQILCTFNKSDKVCYNHFDSFFFFFSGWDVCKRVH